MVEKKTEPQLYSTITDSLTLPLRVACVDVGSNALRFIAAEFSTPDTYQILDQQRAAVRLGHDVFLTGRLTAAAMDAARTALADFFTRMKEHNVQAYRAVATSAVRESSNGVQFVDLVRDQTGLMIEVISGSEEARLVHTAVKRAFSLAEKEWIITDVGGGSVEVLLVDDSGILWSESHTMGSVRLLEELASVGEQPGRFRRLLEEYTSTLRLPSVAAYRKPAGFIATGGNAEALAGLANQHAQSGQPAVISIDTLRAIIETLSRMSYRQRVDDLGLREDRADVILPAALIYERLALLAQAQEIIVPGVGIKEGVLFDLVEATTTRQIHQDRRTQGVLAAATTMGRRFMFDESHACQVSKHALSLFDQLADLHGMGITDRCLLAAAALLHDIGGYISYKGHHKHSLYLISQAELPGFSSTEITIVANIARYHRKGEPAPHHESFASLNAADQERVVKLASILRLADALDREHAERVSGVSVERGEKEIVLHLEGVGDLLLEKWALARKSTLFESVFRLRVKVKGGREG